DGDTASAPPSAEKPRQQPTRRATRSRRAQVAERAVKTTAPSSVSWALPTGKRVGKGSARLEVPANVDALVATTPGTLGRSRVRIVDGKADYGALSSGRLSLRVFPFAKVTVGKQGFGTTPLSPLALLEGSYTVTLEHEGKVV